MKDESPAAAVRRVLGREFGIEPSNVQTMMLIDAVRDALPPKRETTIATLRAILRTLEPHDGLEAWAIMSAREIVGILSRHDREQGGYWCTVEGTIAAMLTRVTSGQDL